MAKRKQKVRKTWVISSVGARADVEDKGKVVTFFRYKKRP